MYDSWLGLAEEGPEAELLYLQVFKILVIVFTGVTKCRNPAMLQNVRPGHPFHVR